MTILKNRDEIEHYLGITDNEDMEYKNRAVEDYTFLFEKYKDDTRDIEYGLIEDMGLYLPYTEIIEKSKLVCAFIPDYER